MGFPSRSNEIHFVASHLLQSVNGTAQPAPEPTGELLTIWRQTAIVQIVCDRLRFRFDRIEVLGVGIVAARTWHIDVARFQRICQREAHGDFKIATMIQLGLVLTAYALSPLPWQK